MKVEKAYYLEEYVVFKFSKFTGDTFLVKMGYIPETKTYIAVRNHDPLFCLSGNTLEEAKQKAFEALEFYVEHGLEERVDK